MEKLVSLSDGDFWRKGRVLAHFGEASAFIIDGKLIFLKWVHVVPWNVQITRDKWDCRKGVSKY